MIGEGGRGNEGKRKFWHGHQRRKQIRSLWKEKAAYGRGESRPKAERGRKRTLKKISRTGRGGLAGSRRLKRGGVRDRKQEEGQKRGRLRQKNM